jgi:hypothetical protein
VATLLAALVAAVGLLFLPDPSTGPARAEPKPVALSTAWPGATVVHSAGRMSDGAPVEPLQFVDAHTLVATALSTDGAAVRLVIITAGSATEIHRVAAELFPKFSGVAVVGDTMVWAESTASAGAGVRTILWRVNWRTPGTPVMITGDMGDARLFQSQHDLVIADDAVHWVASDKGNGTQVRSVSVRGGKVKVRHVAGGYILNGWPWLITVSVFMSGPVDMLNLDTGQRIVVPRGPVETVRCGPMWCVDTVGTATATIRIDLMHPDGSQRHRVAGPGSWLVDGEVPMLDRFVPFTADAADRAASSVSQQLNLYDMKSGRTIVVDPAAESVRGAGSVLWWSHDVLSGNPTWYALDVRDLQP